MVLQKKPIELLWAKTNREKPEEYHLLLYHMLESAAVAQTLWEKVMAGGVRRDIVSYFQLPSDTMGVYLAFWIGLHDIGKATPAFQQQAEKTNPALVASIQQTGLPIDPTLVSAYHSLLSGKYLAEKECVPKQVEVAISGHHGTWNTNYRVHSLAYGGDEWNRVRDEYVDILRKVLAVPQDVLPSIDDTKDSNVFATWLSGMICVADWLASNADYFPYQQTWEDPDSYFRKACQTAMYAVRKAGWVGWRSTGEQVSFGQMYAFKRWRGARPIQQQAIDAYEGFAPEEPFIMVVEAPTGIGKTEIALYLADRWLQKTDGNGLYVAMPTQATSNQLYERSLDVLKNRYQGQAINLVLAHGQARWNEVVNAIRIQEVGEQGEEDVFAAGWFQNNRKRTLLAPFGVGTVDQVFLSILQTKHFFVRLFGLKNKVIIFDEVHAYDTYMNTLFHRLLAWLRALGTSVIILSATLPDDTRKELLAHYSGYVKEEISGDQQYPRVSMASPQRKVQVTPLENYGEERDLKIKWIEEGELAPALEERLSDGGCAAVICNTVKQAQQLYQKIKEKNIVAPEDLILFHARFPFRWRKEIEDKVVKRFGKDATRGNGGRPYKAIVVATQVIEQSLDLDFDLMVTALAPIDLVLQRAGRLHRHDRGEERPKQLQEAELVILKPNTEDKDVSFGTSEKIYDKSKLLRTYLVLQKENIGVVRSTRNMIEAVYGENSLPGVSEEQSKIIEKYAADEEIKTRKQAKNAKGGLVSSPDDLTLQYQDSIGLIDTDSPLVHHRYRALTRDIGPSITIVCAQMNDGNIYIYSGTDPINIQLDELGKRKDLIPTLMENSLSITSIQNVLDLMESHEVIYLPNSYAHMVVFENNVFRTQKYQYYLDKEIGLLVDPL